MNCFTLFLIALLSLSEIPITRWVDPFGRKPIGKAEFERIVAFPKTGKIGCIRHPRLTQNLVDVVVNSRLYPEIESVLNIYITDLEADGFSVRVDTMGGGSASQLRNHLAGLLQQGLKGAVFIGTLPVAWYYMPEPSLDMTEEFPIDYYFMDLDGNWIDSDLDGLLDQHSGSTAPEIWVGRICAGRMSIADERTAIIRYFEKIHAYRTGQLALPDRALSLVDDDWIYWYDTASLDLLYDTVVVVNATDLTNAEEYRSRLQAGYSFVHLFSHSSPWGHTFKPENVGGTFFNFEILPLSPRAFFYNLFSCSATRFVESDDIANCYLFYSDYCLLVVGSTKTGAMPEGFEDFYGCLAAGHCFGEAFRSWMELYAEESPNWCYGLCILGDPTLKLLHNPVNSEPSVEAAFPNSWPSAQLSTDEKTDAQVDAIYYNGNLYAAWSSGRIIRSDIIFSYRTPTGWASPQIVAFDEMWDFFPTLAHKNGNVWVIWQSMRDFDHNIYSAEWNGSSFQGPYRISNDDAAYDLTPAAVSIEDTAILVVFKTWRNANADLYYSINCTGWTTPQPVALTPEDEVDPVLTVDTSGRVWLFYSVYRNGSWDIEGRYFMGLSEGFSSPILVAATSFNERFPAACPDSTGKLWIIWEEDRGSSSWIVSGYLADSVFHGPYVISSGSNDFKPFLAPYRGELVAAWTRDNGGNLDIYVSFLGSDTVWLEPQPAVATLNQEMFPRLVTAGDTIFLFYQANWEGNWDIYLAEEAVSVAEGSPKGQKPARWASTTFLNPEKLADFLSNSDEPFEIFDVTGRRIAVLKAKEGNILRSLRSGLYFYRMKARGEIHRGSFLIVK